ncbi:MAG: electron transport complex subunit RsxC [Planctomycetota bacterium]|jgi:electron transport complex protein RnfC
MADRMPLTFPGGVHPHDYKEFSNQIPCEIAPLPQEVRVPLAQHIGAPARAIVKKKDTVKMGQVIGEPQGFVSAAVHAPLSGTVKDVKPFPHIFGRPTECIVIESDGKDEWAEGVGGEPEDVSNIEPAEIIERVKAAGIVGMGGATFPTHVKLSPPPDFKYDTVIINGVECEPFLTSDHRLMLEEPERVLRGAELLRKSVGGKRLLIGIEANKPDAIAKMRETAKQVAPDAEVIELHVKYPQGAEKQLIYAATCREVPAPRKPKYSPYFPMHVGALVQNVGTAAAVYDAVTRRIPLIERNVTVTGTGVESPKNLKARIGTPIQSLLDMAKVKPDANKLILGGPMMGLAQGTPDLPVNKGMSGILVLTGAKVDVSRACIRCGKCVEVCPQWIMPQTLSILAEAERFDLMEDYDIDNCMLCGSCSYVCPSKRPIVHLIEWARGVINGIRRKKAEEEKKKQEEKAPETAKA